MGSSYCYTLIVFIRHASVFLVSISSTHTGLSYPFFFHDHLSPNPLVHRPPMSVALCVEWPFLISFSQFLISFPLALQDVMAR